MLDKIHLALIAHIPEQLCSKMCTHSVRQRKQGRGCHATLIFVRCTHLMSGTYKCQIENGHIVMLSQLCLLNRVLCLNSVHWEQYMYLYGLCTYPMTVVNQTVDLQSCLQSIST